jgi:hypothetical protein
VWHAGDPAAVPACKRYFRGTVEVPQAQTVSEASIRLTADNDFVLYVNGKEAGGGSSGHEDWRRARTIDLAGHLKAGRNTLAVMAENFDVLPNPAGLIGAYKIVLGDGTKITGCIDKSWKSAEAESAGWNTAGFDDASWSPLREIARYGDAPWGPFETQTAAMMLPPVKEADPFVGRFTVPQDWLREDLRVCLEAADIPHESAAAVAVNGRYAGGFIGKPFRLDVTDHLKAGENTVEVVPFAPASVRVTVYSTKD